jgi:tetratricopeptide (TPR) repeat protein
VADLEQALVLDPNNSLALHNLAIMTKSSGAEGAENLLTEAIEKNQNLPYPRAERAYQRLQKNDYAGALEDYNEVIRLDPNEDENYLNRGLVKEKLDDLKGAALDFAKAIELNAKNEKAWLCHGNTLLKSGKWAEAIEDYSTAIHLRPDYKLAYYNRAIANLNAGQLPAACSDLKNAEKFGIVVEQRVRKKACP